VDFDKALHIVELGTGTGCVTRALLKRMRPDARLISLDVNDAFVKQCRDIQDERLVLRCACATLLPQLLEEEAIDTVDAVVSSLPLALMEEDVVNRIVDSSSTSLRPGGKFLQYQYSLKHMETLNRHFGDVRVGFVPYNVPPAFVFECSDVAEAGQTTERTPAQPASLYAAMLSTVGMAVRTLLDL